MNKQKIRFLVMDVDGTLTDGKIYMGVDGEMMKAFDVKDGCGIKDILPQYGIVPIIITARNSKILENRCRELEIEQLYQGIRKKREKLDELLKQFSAMDGVGYSYVNVAYVGDDILDLRCMEPIKAAGGIIGCPADAVKQVLTCADFVSSQNGGNGAVREFIEWLIASGDENYMP